MIRAKLNAIAAVRNRLRTFSMPRSQVRFVFRFGSGIYVR